MQDVLREQLGRAREQYAAGAVAEAVRSCVAVVGGCTETTDPLLVAAAATLVRRPVDHLLRARVHALASDALALLNRAGPAGQEAAARVVAQVAATRDVFRVSEPVDVVRLAEDAARIGGEHSDAAFLRLPFAFEAARHQGTAKPLLDAVREQVELLPFVARTWLCVALKSAGLRAEAADEWRALAAHVAAVPVEAPEFLMAIADAADVCTWLGDEANAATLYATLLPYEHQHVIAHAHAPTKAP